MKTIARAVPAAQSLGRFLRGEMGLSHHQVSSLKPLNAILVNGVPRHTNYYLSPGDVVEVRLKGGPAAARPCEGPVHIVYEDSDLFIIDKSAPLPTLSSVHKDGDTLEGRMARLYPDTPFRPVNRLDKGTSGLMCAARHAHAQYALSALLHTDKFQREYLAVVEGVPSPLSGVIDAPREVRGGPVPGPFAPFHGPHPPDPGAHGTHRLSCVRRLPLRPRIVPAPRPLRPPLLAHHHGAPRYRRDDDFRVPPAGRYTAPHLTHFVGPCPAPRPARLFAGLFIPLPVQNRKMRGTDCFVASLLAMTQA